MKIFLPLICYNHTANTEYMISIIKLVLFCQQNGITISMLPITFESLISRARNASIAHFMSDEDATHILFIDSDISFEPKDVIKLILADKPVVCGAYSQKWLSEERMKDVFTRKEVPRDPLELCTKVSVHIQDAQGSPSDQILEAKYVTTGFLLIHKDVIKQMMAAYPDRKYMNDIDGYQGANPDMFYDLFPVTVDNKTYRYESEDYGFTRLWNMIGGKAYVATDISLTHHGWYGYKSNLHRQLTVL